MSKQIFLLVCIVFFQEIATSQVNLKGLWQGVLLKDGAKESESMPFFIQFEDSDGAIGRSREEVFNTEFYAVCRTKGSRVGNSVKFQQTVSEKQTRSTKVVWCMMSAEMEFIDSTGYLLGKFTSSSCKRHSGKIILFRSKAKFSDTDSGILSHSWRDIFLDDLKHKRKAPEIREMERKNFVFQPIYFDYDKAIVKPEFHTFLVKMIRVVNGHSDLRIKITGHTDADGSDAYNDQLSKQRAQALKDFFVQNGLAADRLVIDFKGEKAPIDSNNTPEGKQRNRRVDFEFI
jgi:outer membrane protein OmpA-like peptidoglycan-associated protein